MSVEIKEGSQWRDKVSGTVWEVHRKSTNGIYWVLFNGNEEIMHGEDYIKKELIQLTKTTEDYEMEIARLNKYNKSLVEDVNNLLEENKELENTIKELKENN